MQSESKVHCPSWKYFRVLVLRMEYLNPQLRTCGNGIPSTNAIKLFTMNGSLLFRGKVL